MSFYQHFISIFENTFSTHLPRSITPVISINAPVPYPHFCMSYDIIVKLSLLYVIVPSKIILLKFDLLLPIKNIIYFCAMIFIFIKRFTKIFIVIIVIPLKIIINCVFNSANRTLLYFIYIILIMSNILW